MMTLAEYPKKALVTAMHEGVVKAMVEVYRNDPDAGVHSAAELLLYRCGEEARAKQATEPFNAVTGTTASWHVNSMRHEMVQIDGPVDFDMGSPPSDPDHQKEEIFHRRTVPRRFAIASKEVTIAQFQEYATAAWARHTNMTRRLVPTRKDRRSM